MKKCLSNYFGNHFAVEGTFSGTVPSGESPDFPWIPS